MSGLRAQIGWKIEGTYGTAETVNTFLPLISENVVKTQDPIITPGLIGGRRFPTVGQFEAGPVYVSGGITLDLHTHNIESLLRLMIGGDPTPSGPSSGLYTRTYTPAALPSATFEIVRPTSISAGDEYLYDGCMASGWSVSVSTGGIAQLTLDLVGQGEVVTAAGGGETISLPTVMTRFKWDQVAVTFDGLTNLCVTDLTITGNNGLTTDELCLGSSVISQPREDNHREYALDMTLRYPGAGNDTPTVNRGASVAATIAMTSGSHTLTFTLGNLLVVNAPVSVGGPGRVEQTVNCRMLGSAAADSGAISVALVNTTTP